MYICKLCNKEFQKSSQLVSHLSNPKSFCKISIKEYYDKFLRKENEGICIFCGNETSFYGITKGYINNTCKHCKNNKLETKKIRKENYDKKREKEKIEKGYYDLPFKCGLCEKKFAKLSGLSRHVFQIHKNITIKEYYDNFLKKENEGICPVTNLPTNFKDLTSGYYKYYERGTCSRDNKVLEKRKETLLKNYNTDKLSYVNMKDRVFHFKETFAKRRKLNEERFKLISILRKLTIDKTNKLQCQICGKQFKTFFSLSSHIRNHNIYVKDYYDKYFKSEGEGICPISNSETTFDSLERGYFKYHKLFVTLSDEIKEGSLNSRLKYIKNKAKESESLYNVKFLNIDSMKYISDILKIKCLKCNEIYENRFTNLILGYGKCPKCFPKNKHVSDNEKEILTYVKEICGQNTEVIGSYMGLIKNPKTGKNLELDIFVPDKKFAIEFNGLYWHSDAVLKNPESYHLNKFIECKKLGIRLIQIFEDEWINKKEIILSMIKHKLLENNSEKIYARKCIIKEISTSDKNSFLDENHIQGKDYSKIKLGSFYNDELVAVMTFSNGNISRGGNPKDLTKWELSRFCTKNKYIVTGIASKLLSYFKNNFEWREIYSYADLRFSDGNVYRKLGFEVEKQNEPSYFYVKGMKRIHRFNLRKLSFEPKEVPEKVLRYNQGYLRVWDCGNLKFVITKK